MKISSLYRLWVHSHSKEAIESVAKYAESLGRELQIEMVVAQGHEDMIVCDNCGAKFPSQRQNSIFGCSACGKEICIECSAGEETEIICRECYQKELPPLEWDFLDQAKGE